MERTSEAGFPFVSILTLIFITLKLTGNIDWSWWWVLSPIWITFLVVVFIGIVVAVGIHTKNKLEDRRYRKLREEQERRRQEKDAAARAKHVEALKNGN